MIDTFGDERLRKQKRFFCYFLKTGTSTLGKPFRVEAYLAFEKKADRDAACVKCDCFQIDRAKVLKVLGRFSVIDGVCVSQRKKDKKTFYDDLIAGFRAKIFILARMRNMEEKARESKSINMENRQEGYIKDLQKHLKQQEKDFENLTRNNYMH